MKKHTSCILYMAGVDVSLDCGAGINERGFVASVANRTDILCVLPSPMNPGNYFDKRHFYVFNHLGLWWRFPLYWISLFRMTIRLSKLHSIRGFVVRQGVAVVMPMFLSWYLRAPLLIKSYTGNDPYESIPIRHLLASRKGWNKQMLQLRFANVVLRRLYKKLPKKAAVIDCPSFTCRDIVIKNTNLDRNIVIAIANGADSDFYRPHPDKRTQIRRSLGIPADAFVVGYAGAIVQEVRCLDSLVEALVGLSGEKEFYGLFLGHGPSLELFKNRVSDAGMTKNILFPGFVPNNRIPEFISAMDVAADMTAVCMKTKEGTNYASFSQKIAQYLACGTPVIAWELQDNKFITENALGALARLFDVENLAEQIKQLRAMSNDERLEMRNRARCYAEKWLSYSTISTQRLQIWNNALDAHKKNEVL